MTPTEIILVRHGESEGNAAAAAADLADAETVDIDARDADVELTQRGREQAQALGRWLGGLDVSARPEAVVSSPYVRARDTATIALQTAGLELPLRVDDRLRDRELGILDRLTGRGVTARYPDEAERRRRLGKMYHRPPGGESWADVALRLRSLLTELETAPVSRLLLSCHDVVILLVRYVLEDLTEDELMSIAASESVRNAAVTRIVRDDASAPWRTVLFNDVTHLTEDDVPVTEHEGRREDDG